MNVEEIRDYALQMESVEESFPFGENTLVFKTNNKIFLLMGIDEIPVRFNVKCNPDIALELREQYPAVIPGFHMNKKHWNTIIVDGSLSRQLLKRMIDDSYELVKLKMKTKK